MNNQKFAVIPPFLKKGDKIRIISPAGKIEPRYVYAAVGILESLGFTVEIAKNALSEYERFAGTDEQRAGDINEAIKDDTVKAIRCSRGGYGVIRIIDKNEKELRRSNPKWLIGYSDITALHALFSESGTASLHAQMCRAIAEDSESESVIAVTDLLYGKPHQIKTENPHTFNIKGSARGKVCGGNLAVIGGLRATPYDFDYQDAILFIEDIGETPYKVDRLIQNLKLSGVFSRIKALIVGQFTDCGCDDGQESIYRNIKEITAEYNIPVCFDFPVGHVGNNMPLIEGGEAELLITDQTVTLDFSLK